MHVHSMNVRIVRSWFVNGAIELGSESQGETWKHWFCESIVCPALTFESYKFVSALLPFRISIDIP